MKARFPVYVPGSSSQEEIDTLNDQLAHIVLEAMAYSPIDFAVGQGARDFETQLEYFLDGKSKLDPRNPEMLERAKHVITENRPLSDAFDIYVWVPGRKDLSYNREALTFIAGHIIGTAKRLLHENKIDFYLRWGGNWDMDGEILSDQRFDDLPHFELVRT